MSIITQMKILMTNIKQGIPDKLFKQTKKVASTNYYINEPLCKLLYW